MNIRGGANDSDLPTPEELTKEIQSMTPEQITAAKAASHETMQDDVVRLIALNFADFSFLLFLVMGQANCSNERGP